MQQQFDILVIGGGHAGVEAACAAARVGATKGLRVGLISFDPAMIGAMLVMNGTWQKPGVYNIEEFDPDPFMDALNKWGLPWKESWDPALVD